MLSLVRDGHPLLVRCTAEQPTGDHNLRTNHAGDQRSDRRRDTHPRTGDIGDRPCAPHAAHAALYHGEGHQQDDAGEHPECDRCADDCRRQVAPCDGRRARQCIIQRVLRRENGRREAASQRRLRQTLGHLPCGSIGNDIRWQSGSRADGAAHGRERQRECGDHRADPHPSNRQARAAHEPLGGARAGNHQQRDGQTVHHEPDHFLSPRRSASSRRICSSSLRPSFLSETICANMRSAEPWKMASRILASALPPARSASTVGK